jgi:hypothetical protein
MPQLGVDDLRPLLGAPRLRAASLGLGSVRKNEAGAALLGLPSVKGAFDWRT